MFYKNTCKKNVLTGHNFLNQYIAISLPVILLSLISPTAVLAGGKYESSSDSRFFYSLCTQQIDNLRRGGSASISDAFSYGLGDCLVFARNQTRRLVLNYTNCDLLEVAAAESCRDFWGFMGNEHKGCLNERSNLVGRNPAWVNTFGYCHTACPSVNLPIPDQPPFNTPPCGLNVIPPNLDDNPNRY